MTSPAITALKTYGTILTMSAGGKDVLPFYSARGLDQTLDPIDAAMYQRRTINIEKVDLSLPAAKKYASVITAKDRRPPSRDDVWPGTKVWVGCAYWLSYSTVGGSPQREVVSGSQVVEGAMTFYRPLIQFMIAKPSGKLDEWLATYDWTMPMEEV